MADNKLVAAIDIGTTKIVALVAEADAEGRLYVIAHGQAPAVGLRRCLVVDMDKTVSSIKRAVADAGMVGGVEIDRVTVGMAGEHIRSINSHGVIAVSRSDNEVSAADVRRAIDAARAVAIPVDREIIHVVPQGFTVDEQSGIKDPIGMSGVRLEVETHIVTASITTARNLFRALERCGLEIDHIVLEGLALSNVVLSESDMENGAILVDIGGDITSLSVFFDGSIRHTATVSLGGRNVTNDIAIGLRTSVEQAESIKIASGAAVASAVSADEMITVSTPGAREDREISRHVLASIIEPRMEEIFSLTLREMKRSGIGDTPTGGIVLCGGGSALPGSVDLAEQIFDMPVRAGELSGYDHTPDELATPAYATAHGLAAYGFRHEPMRGRRRSSVRNMLKKMENWISNKF